MSGRGAGRRGGAPIGRRRFIGQAAGLAALGLGWGCAGQRLSRFAALGGEGEGAPRPLFTADVHCHAFNALDLPLDGFLRNLLAGVAAERLGGPGEVLVRWADPAIAAITGPVTELLLGQTPTGEAELIADALKTGRPLAAAPPLSPLREEVRRMIAELAERVPDKAGAAIRDAALPLANALAILAAHRYQVVTAMLDEDEQVQLFTPSLVDFEYWTRRHLRKDVEDCRTPIAEQVKLHSQISLLAQRGLLPTRRKGRRVAVHPFVPYNPYREAEGGGAFELVRTALEEHGYVGVKLYPANGFLPTHNARLEEFQAGELGVRLDAALDRLYGHCESAKIPILTHAAYSNGFGADLAWRGSPWGWAEVLERYPRLRIDFGHFGHMTGVPSAGPLKEEQLLDCLVWAKKIAGLMADHEGVYADLSNSPIGLVDPSAAPGTDCPIDDPGTARRQDCYAHRFRPFLDLLLKSHPTLASRIMYGTDWWMNVREADPFRGRVEAFFAKAPPELKAGFFGGNALRFLGLDDLEGDAAKRLRAFFQVGEGELAWDHPRNEGAT